MASLQHDNASHNDVAARNDNGENTERQQQQRRTFFQFSLLHEDLQLCILSFVAQVPLESLPHSQSPVTHVFCYVSHHFYNMCQSDYLWQMALERLVLKEPLWREGLAKLCPAAAATAATTDSSCATTPASNDKDDTKENDLVRLCHEELNEPGYMHLFQRIVADYLRFTGPVFIMSGVVRLGERIDLHFFEPRYRLLIATIMQDYPPEARQGHPIQPNDTTGQYPTFCYAHMAPFAPTTPACLVQVRQCTVHANGSADVMLVPTAYVWMERLWEAPNTGRLHYAQCLRMPTEEGRQLETQNFRQMPRGFENPLIEMLLQDRGLMGGGGGAAAAAGGGGGREDVPMGLQLPLRAMLNYLVHEHGNRESDEEDDDEEEDDTGVAAD